MPTIINLSSGAGEAVTGTTETPVLYLPAAAAPQLYSSQQTPVHVTYSGNVTPGTAATAMTYKLYGGPAGATLLLTVTMPVTAGALSLFGFDYLDTSGAINSPGGCLYRLTMTQTAATGNGSVGYVFGGAEQQ